MLTLIKSGKEGTWLSEVLTLIKSGKEGTLLFDTDDCSCYCYSFPTTGLTTQGKDNINYVALSV